MEKLETRNILNFEGEVIGILELPCETSEDVWQEKLSKYNKPPETKILKDITPRQIRQALLMSGVSIESIEAEMYKMAEPARSLAKIEWEYSIAFQRNRPLIVQMGAMLGLSPAQIDSLWELAASL